jgi:toxin ParE1/3/4
MPRVIRRAAALRDLAHHFAYLATQAGLATADRFLEAAGHTFADLADMPLMGTPGKVRQGKFAGVRLWRVRGFENYLICYRSLPDGVQIERVIHAAQDYQRILGC